MRRAIGVFLFVLLAIPAFGRSWRAATRADWRSLDCLKRRLEYILKHVDDDDLAICVKKCLLHVTPMLKRHGGAFKKHNRIILDSEDGELALIMAQNGNANRAGNWGDLLGQWWDGTGGRVWRWIVHTFYTSLFWLFITGLLWYLLFRRGKKIRLQSQELSLRDDETIATHRAIERSHPDKKERGLAFNDPLTARAHRRVKQQLGL